MNNKNRVLLTIGVLVAIVGGILVYQNYEKSNKKEGVRSFPVTFKNGETYEVTVGKFEPPFIASSDKDPNSNFDQTNITETVDGIFSISPFVCKDKPELMEKYFSLMTKEAKQDILSRDKNGELFANCEKSTENKEIKHVFLYWVELEKDGKTYRKLVGKSIYSGEEWPGMSMTFTKENGKWVQVLTTPFDKPYSQDSGESISFDLGIEPSYEAFVEKYGGRTYQNVDVSGSLPDTPNVKTTKVQNKITDADILQALESVNGKLTKNTDAKIPADYLMLERKGGISMISIAKGDLDNNGDEDAIIADLWCAASCGSQFIIVLNRSSMFNNPEIDISEDSARIQSFQLSPEEIKTSGAGQVTIKKVAIKEGVIYITFEDKNKTITYEYLLDLTMASKYYLRKCDNPGCRHEGSG